MSARRSQIVAASTLLLCWPLCVAWLNPQRDEIAEANRLLKSGKYQEAIQKYGQQLVDQPESALLNYNMGNANYKAGKFSEALASYARVRSGDDDPKRTARTAYNAGNAQYRLAAAMEKDKPQDALKAYALALAAYRRALGVDPSDQDSKFNYELTTKRLADLQKRLQEEKDKQQKKQEDQKQQQQDQQQNQQKQDQQKQDQQKQDQQQQQSEDQQQQQPDQPQQEENQSSEQDEQQQQQQQQAPDQQPQDADQQAAQQNPQAGGEPNPEEDQTQQGSQAAAGGEASEEAPQDTSQREAAALLDSAKNEELSPQEFSRRVQGAAVAEPAQDW